MNPKTLYLIIPVLSLILLCCKGKENAPSPIQYKYEYKRTPGEVTKIEGNIFVDTGGTVFTVKGKGFDPSRKRFYHLLVERYCSDAIPKFNLNGYFSDGEYRDTLKIEQITDSTIKFKSITKNIFTVRKAEFVESNCNIKDSVKLVFAVTSKDSTNIKSIVTQFDILQTKKVKNKLFFHILKDTLIWHKNSGYKPSEIALTLDDVIPGGGYKDLVALYFNDLLINTTDPSYDSGMPFDQKSTFVGDSYFLFEEDLYADNKSLGLKDGEYTITMKEKKTGIPIEEKHGRNKVYVKFVD